MKPGERETRAGAAGKGPRVSSFKDSQVTAMAIGDRVTVAPSGRSQLAWLFLSVA